MTSMYYEVLIKSDIKQLYESKGKDNVFYLDREEMRLFYAPSHLRALAACDNIREQSGNDAYVKPMDIVHQSALIYNHLSKDMQKKYPPEKIRFIVKYSLADI